MVHTSYRRTQAQAHKHRKMQKDKHARSFLKYSLPHTPNHSLTHSLARALSHSAALARGLHRSQVYMSHTLEHIDYMDALQPALREVARVIRSGGVFRCSVPDLAILCEMFLHLQGDDDSSAGKQSWRLRCGHHTEEWSSSSFQHAGIQDPILPVMRMQVMRMIFGGQMDAFDHHRVGFDFCILRGFLLAAGFSSVQRVDQIDQVLPAGKQNYAESPHERATHSLLRVWACTRQQGTCPHKCGCAIRIRNRIHAPSTLSARMHARTHARTHMRSLFRALTFPYSFFLALLCTPQYGFQDTSSFLFYGSPISINVVATK